MEYKYYVQEYAKKRAENILPVPNNYSLRGDFGPNFISDFTALTKILKKYTRVLLKILTHIGVNFILWIKKLEEKEVSIMNQTSV